MKSFIEVINEAVPANQETGKLGATTKVKSDKIKPEKTPEEETGFAPQKGKTIGGDTPNQINVKPQYILRADGIKEEKTGGRTVVFSFGRMNPPTIGHEKLVKAIEAKAKSIGAVPRLYLSRTEGDAKNPLPYSKKSKFAKMAFPIVKDTPKNMMPSGFIGLLKHLEDQFDNVVIVVGSDRLANVKKLAEKYNGSEYKYNSVEVVSAGERDPDEEGVGGMSASKMRQAVQSGNFAAFKSGLPVRLKGVARTVYDELANALNEELDEAVLTLTQRLKRRSQMRRSKSKIRLGQRRALARKASGKTISKRSKRVAIKLIRKRILRGRKYQDLSYASRAAVDRQVARRKGAISRIAKRIEPKLRQAESRRKSGTGYKSISLGPVRPKKKLKEEMTQDNLIQVVTEMFSQIAEEVRIPLTALEHATLVRKCNESNVSFKTIQSVFDRGVASWYAGLREGSTPQQWGFARVNSFLANGITSRTADRDLMEAEDKHATLAKIKNKETKSRTLVGYLKSADDEVKKAADEELKKRRSSGDVEAGKSLDKHYNENPGSDPDNPPQEIPQPQLQTPKYSSGIALALAKSLSSKPLTTQEVETASTKGSAEATKKAVEKGESLGADLDSEDAYTEFKPSKVKSHQDKLESISSKLPSIKDKDLRERQSILVKGWGDFINAKNFKQRIDAVKTLADAGLIEGHALGRKIYLPAITGLPEKYFGNNDEILQKMNAVIESAAIEVPIRGSSADLSGKENEAGVVALLHPSDENTKAHKKVFDQYQASGGDMKKATKQNEAASEEIKKDIAQSFGDGAKVISAQQVGGLGANKLKELDIDQKTDPTDILVTVKDKKGQEHTVKYSMKVYKDVNNITMRNAGGMTFGENFIGGEAAKRLDSLVPTLRQKYPYNEDTPEQEATNNKKAIKQEYMTALNKELVNMAKNDEGQAQLLDMWRKIYGCGKNVKVVVTNKKTLSSKVKSDSDYCNPKQPFKVSYDGIKVVVNVDEESGFTTQFDIKTEKDGSFKVLARYINKNPKGTPRAKSEKTKREPKVSSKDINDFMKKKTNESFLSFGDFLQESSDTAVGNVPTINAKPVHHKASGHKYHIDHMIDPNLGLKQGMQHAKANFDRDVDSDIDQFDKKTSKLPDEVSVPTKTSTKQFFAKYKKEREHIHAGEPIDETKETPKYTGDENSWYHDASGQKVRVYSQSDLKHPEDVGEFLKNPTREKDIGPMMSMKDFLKTQPEKKK